MRRARFWFRNEKEVMYRLGFKPVPGSGSGWIHKEDGESDLAIAQLKSTEAESYRINYLDLEKLEYHASVSHKLPVFVLEFLNRGTYVMFNVDDLGALYQALRDGVVEKEESVVVDEKATVVHRGVKSSKSDRERFYKERNEKWKKQKRVD